MTTTQTFERRLLAYTAVAGAALACAAPAQAAFIGAYDVANWTVDTSNNSDGGVNTSGAPASVIVIGSDNGTGSAGTTDFTIAAVAGGLVSFDWDYTSGDVLCYDQGGYLLNGVFTLLACNANAPAFGSASFAVLAGDIFGFRVLSTDNIVGPGFLAISNFTGPGQAQAPVPSTLLLLAAGALAGGLARRRRAQAISH